MKGPYKFSGAKAEEVNWPFRGNDMQWLIHQSAGNHPVTAKAIAQKVGIIGPHSQTKEQVAELKHSINTVSLKWIQQQEYLIYVIGFALVI